MSALPQTVRQLWPRNVVEKIFHKSKSSIYAKQRRGTFPPAIHVGVTTRWISDEIEAFRDFVIANPRATDTQLRKFVADLVAKRPTIAEVA